ncbi:MAG: SRPBCC domain-containing protein [Bacteroidota bacterium]
MKTTEPPVIVEQTFNTPIQKVWNALTVLDEMVQWFFPNIPEYSAEIGFTTEFIVDSGERSFPHLWKVLEVIPQKKMVQEWRYEGYPGLCTVAFELQEKEGQTLLAVTSTVLEDFPDNIPEFRRDSCLAGWQYFIQQNLKQYLDG